MAFQTWYRYFEWVVILFGLTNTLTVFQWFINNIFLDLLNICVVIYLNDMFQYQEHIQEVLYWFYKARLYVKAKKCEFHSNSIEYPEFILSLSILTIFSNKINTIQNWPKPKKVKDVQVFLDFANFYHWFIYNYSDIAALLT